MNHIANIKISNVIVTWNLRLNIQDEVCDPLQSGIRNWTPPAFNRENTVPSRTLELQQARLHLG